MCFGTLFNRSGTFRYLLATNATCKVIFNFHLVSFNVNLQDSPDLKIFFLSANTLLLTSTLLMFSRSTTDFLNISEKNFVEFHFLEAIKGHQNNLQNAFLG